MLGTVDLFVMFRWMVATVCAIYAAVCIIQSLWRWLNYIASSRHTVILGRYTAVLLLRTKIQRFWGDICQIVFLLAMLSYVIYIHRIWG